VGLKVLVGVCPAGLLGKLRAAIYHIDF
jgi:hypothetical protein